MKFNIKSAMEYSSKLKNVIAEVESSLRVSSTLINHFAAFESGITTIPATQNGIYEATITHQKSKVNDIVGKTLNDEVVEVKATGDFTQLDPNIRLNLLNDLIQERLNIDCEIEAIKNNSTIIDEFTKKEVTYDLGCQINKMYRDYNQNVLKYLVEMDSSLTTTINGKMTVMSNSDEKGSATVTYPIEIKAESKIDREKVLKEYNDINDKCTINSANLSAVEISKFFDYEPKFNLNPSIRSLIEKYKDIK